MNVFKKMFLMDIKLIKSDFLTLHPDLLGSALQEVILDDCIRNALSAPIYIEKELHEAILLCFTSVCAMHRAMLRGLFEAEQPNFINYNHGGQSYTISFSEIETLGSVPFSRTFKA